MSDLQHPDDVIRALRGPATAGELAGEHETVDRMVTIRHRHEESTVKTFARPSRIAALVAAGVLGFGGVAAAGPGGFDPLGLESDDPSLGEEIVEDEEEIVEDEEAVVDEDEEEGIVAEEEIVEEEIVEEEDVEKEDVAEDESVEPQAAEAMEEEPTEPPLFADNDDTYFNEELCLPGPHGRTVSAFARGELEFEGYDYDVSDVAKSDCGKPWLRPWEPEDETDAAGDESVAATDVEAEVEEVDERRGPPAHAGGGADKGAKDKADKADKGNRGGGKGRGGR